MNRREFLDLLMRSSAALGAAGMGLGMTSRAWASSASDLYKLPSFGSARLLHITDTHAQLNPIYFREPNVNLGLASAYGKLPHRVGKNLLSELGSLSPLESHAFTYLNFEEAANRFGKVGGFAHLKTLIDQLRGDVADGQSLLLDGGDTWQGSGTALWTRGQDMVGACNLLGVDVMTGHWEFTYNEEEVLENLDRFNGEFVAQNIRVTEDALFMGAAAFDEDSGHAFRPYTLREMGASTVAVIGQAFPYTPIANPARFIPDWTFGIRSGELQQLIGQIRQQHRVDAVVLLSHNGL